MDDLRTYGKKKELEGIFRKVSDELHTEFDMHIDIVSILYMFGAKIIFFSEVDVRR